MKYVITRNDHGGHEDIFGIVEAENVEEIENDFISLGKVYDDAQKEYLKLREKLGVNNKFVKKAFTARNIASRTDAVYKGKTYPIYIFAEFSRNDYIITPLEEFIQKHTL